MIVPATLALLAAGGAPPVQVLQPELPVVDGVVRVRDLAHVRRGGDLVVARIRRSVVLTPEEQAQLVRNRLPGVRFTLRSVQAVRIHPQRTGPRARRGDCSVTAGDIPAGHVLGAADILSVSCEANGDRHPLGSWLRRIGGGYMARTTIPAGTPLGAIRIVAAPPLAAKSDVVVRTRIGPVVVERAAETVQPGRPGHRVFVRTQDGEVLVAPLAQDQAEFHP